MKKIHILLSEKSFYELKQLRKSIVGKWELKLSDPLPETYEEYLEKEGKNPTMALFG